MTDASRPSPAEALASWASRVRANAEQVERFREVPDPSDFYAPVSGLFRADPRRTDEPTLDQLRALARPVDSWLDIGAGAGRYALPLALLVREVVAVEPSAGMTQALREGLAEHGIANVRIVEGGWPPDDPTTGRPIPDPPTADVALIAHLGYDIERLGPFLHAMEDAASRLCVAVLMERQPSSVADPFWPIVHGEERIALPALREFLVVLGARDRLFEVRLSERRPRAFESEEEAAGFLRRQLWIAEGGEKDRRFREALHDRVVTVDGQVVLRDQRPMTTGLVSWQPR
jgi:SAM-dependent methyltransferase